MLRATVTGSVWATRRIEKIPNGAFLEVEMENGDRLVAFDVLGSGVGEHVLVATGSVASGWFGDDRPPVDALIIGSIDDKENEKIVSTFRWAAEMVPHFVEDDHYEWDHDDKKAELTAAGSHPVDAHA